MSEYIFDVPDENQPIAGETGLYYPDERDEPMLVHEEIVRCRDCKHYYEAENYHPNGNYVMRCCKYFDAYNDEVEPDGFCAWAERKVDA